MNVRVCVRARTPQPFDGSQGSNHARRTRQGCGMLCSKHKVTNSLDFLPVGDTAEDLIAELTLLTVGVLPVRELVVELVSGGDDGW
jgi:hypothetical protein